MATGIRHGAFIQHPGVAFHHMVQVVLYRVHPKLHPALAVFSVGFRPERVQARGARAGIYRSEEHTSELQSRPHLVCRLLLEKKKKKKYKQKYTSNKYEN